MNGLIAWFRQSCRLIISRLGRFLSASRREWPKHALFLLLFLALALIVTTIISKAYQFWDVGSNSWLDRLKGEGWEFQRGAATMTERDQFGDQFSSVKYLTQGWTPADSMWFYNTTQGSDLLPYDFFMVLEKPGTTELFRSDQNLNYYRYLPQKPTLSDPDALPVGFVKDTYKGKEFLGFTCAACHTAQFNYNGVGIRIDGGPAGTDMDSFLQDLATAVWAERTDSGGGRARFIKNVMDRGNYASKDDVVRDLQNYAQRLSMYNIINHSETRYGYSRLDAFGRIYNRVLEHVITQEELKELLDFTVADLVKDGTLTQADVDSIVPQQRKGGVLSDNQRDHLALRLSQVLTLKTQLKLNQRIYNSPDAPASYPFLWDIPQHDYVQWNGIGANAGLGPIGRNAGEVIGVFGTLDWAEQPGTSLSSFISGQGIRATHVSFRSSVNVHNLRLIENRLRSLQSPQWPQDVFGKIDPTRKARGERLFSTYCESCHTRIKRDDPNRRIVAHMSKLSDVGTDEQMARNASTYVGWSGILRNEYVNAGPGDVLINERAPVAALLTKATLSVVATPEDKNFVERGYQWAYDLAAGFLGNEIKPSLKHGDYDPDTTADPYASLDSYKARSLNGIWATAPYLHNGSVPTLYDLLLPKKGPKDPANGEYRPDTFQVGSREFDPQEVGLKSSGYNGFTFDTSRRGNSNAGHVYGTGLDREQRLDLLEYLKSL
jgi:mono/diheme cytochrome c family protein